MRDWVDENVLVSYNAVPYGLLTDEVPEGCAGDVIDELNQICRYYRVYKSGSDFLTEGTGGDYIPATLHYKLSASLIKKEARFLFAESPDINAVIKGRASKVSEDTAEKVEALNNMLHAVLDKNNFEDALLKAAKDCFIGKRVACVINFNVEDGITITFLPSTQFIYETKQNDVTTLTKFVAFVTIRNSRSQDNKRIFKKKYELVDDVVYLTEQIYNGAGEIIETVSERHKIALKTIPAVIFINDGLTGEMDGESEIKELADLESYYSKMSNGDLDAGRKSMNPVLYALDLDHNSTKNLSRGAGSFWDLMTDQNLTEPHPAVGMLEPRMSYSDSLKTSLDRIKTTAYDSVDMPNVTLETMQGAITSGKSLKAIYWSLIVRCKEKLKMWKPALRRMAEIIIDGAIIYPKCAERYTSDFIVATEYEIEVLENSVIPEDENEEKTMDLNEVESQTMSKKAYMKKWRGLTDDEADEEIRQIALERQILEDSTFNLDEGLKPVEPDADDEENDELTQLLNGLTEEETESVMRTFNAMLDNNI